MSVQFNEWPLSFIKDILMIAKARSAFIMMANIREGNAIMELVHITFDILPQI